MHLKKSEHLENWYYIPVESGSCPEGTREEWLEVVASLRKENAIIGGKRVGAMVHQTVAHFWSPRNCEGPHDHVTVPRADLPAWLDAASAVLANKEMNHDA